MIARFKLRGKVGCHRVVVERVAGAARIRPCAYRAAYPALSGRRRCRRCGRCADSVVLAGLALSFHFYPALPCRAIICRPSAAGPHFAPYPRLAPWAAFFRRFAASGSTSFPEIPLLSGLSSPPFLHRPAASGRTNKYPSLSSTKGFRGGGSLPGCRRGRLDGIRRCGGRR